MERSRRNVKSKSERAREAVEQAQQAKAAGLRRSQAFQVEEKRLYDVVEETEYEKLKSKRAANFVVDDDGLGYEDNGEEDWQRQASEEEEESEEEAPSKSNKKAAGKNKKETDLNKAGQASAGMKRISDMFSKGPSRPATTSSGLSGLGKRKTAAADKKSTGDFMDELLSGLPVKAADKKRRAEDLPVNPARNVSAQPAMAGRRRVPAAAPSAAAAAARSARASFLAPSPTKTSQPEHDDAMVDEMDIGEGVEIDAGGFDTADMEEIERVEAAHKEASAAPAAPVAQPKVTPAKAAPVMNTKFDDADMLDGWRALSALEEEGVEAAEAPAPSTLAGEAGEVKGLPLDDDGALRMFWYDACEEPSRPGRVYVFGKVQLDAAADAGPDAKPRFASCCLQVEDLSRSVFVLPRPFLLGSDKTETDEQANLIQHVNPEIAEICRQKGIKKMRAKKVTRKFMHCFDTDGVPEETEYLKVKYSAEFPALPADLSGKSFSRVFGTTASSLENFLLKRNLMGPSWIKIQNVCLAQSNLSWCKVECVTKSLKNVSVLENPPPPPPLVVMSMHMQTVLNPKQQTNEIIMVSGLVLPEVSCEGPTPNPERQISSFNILRKLEQASLPADLPSRLKGEASNMRCEVAANERALLSLVLAKLTSADPDVLVGHNFLGYHLDILLHRMQHNRIPGWSKLGKLRRTQFPKLKGGAGSGSAMSERVALTGRVVVDTYLASREYLTKETTYTLTELAKTQLKKTRQEPPEHLEPCFAQSDTLLHLVKHTENDAYLTLQLMFKMSVLPLSKQLTCLAGNLWTKSLVGARAERNDFLLLHEFYRQKFLLPDKAWVRDEANNKAKAKAKAVAGAAAGLNDEEDEFAPNLGNGGSSKKRRKAAYAGGLVLEPKRGLYDKYVLLLDFNSLYPTIIQEFNICFTTVRFPGYASEPAADGTRQLAPYELPPTPVGKDGAEEGLGTLPRVVRTLVQRRRQVKQTLKNERDPVKQQQLDIRQQALKILANSMYGCLGFPASRFYAKPLAEMITSQGREILQRTVDMTQTKLNLEVVYGDTDSIMINSGVDDLAQAKEIATAAKKELNKMHRLLELEVDGIYKPLLLLQKKKYAALTHVEVGGKMTTVCEKKGLDLVRRDWCPLSKRLGLDILDLILSGRPCEDVVQDIHAKLRNLADELAAGRVPLEAFVITKGLTKMPHEYPDAKNQPHVQVALQMIKDNRPVAAGMHVPYVVCEGAPSESVSQRAHHPDTVAKPDSVLKVDTKWYLGQQIHPPVARLCAVIEGTDSAQLADCLGLDPSKFKDHSSTSSQSRENVTDYDGDQYRDAERLRVTCRTCKQPSVFEGIMRMNTAGKWVSGLMCDTDECRGKLSTFKPEAIRAAILRQTRLSLEKHHDGWMACADSECKRRTRDMSTAFHIPDEHLPGAQKELGRCCLRRGCTGVMQPEYPASALQLQLQYHSSLVSVAGARRKFEQDNARRIQAKQTAHSDPTLSMSEVDKAMFAKLEEDVNKFLHLSAFNTVDMTSLFAL